MGVSFYHANIYTFGYDKRHHTGQKTTLIGHVLNLSFSLISVIDRKLLRRHTEFFGEAFGEI